MLAIVESMRSMEVVREALQRACANHAFGVLAVHDLAAKLREKGLDQPPCLVFEVCNPAQAKKVLDANPDISSALPCRISLYPARVGQGTRLVTIKPTALIALFGDRELESVAREVEASLDAIMREAAR